MKKVLVILIIGLVLGWMNISTAHAIVIDGIAAGGEWVAPFKIHATDPAESGIFDYLDVKLLLAQWTTPGGDIYIRTDTVIKPEFIKDSGYLNDAYMAWQFDFDGNGSVDLSAQLIKEVDFGHADGNIYYYVGGTQYDNGVTKYWGKDDVYEVLIPAEKVPVFNPGKFQMRLISESASSSGDDNLPDTGWSKTVPEPGSAMLLGMGLVGFVGSLFRRKFNA